VQQKEQQQQQQQQQQQHQQQAADGQQELQVDTSCSGAEELAAKVRQQRLLAACLAGWWELGPGRRKAVEHQVRPQGDEGLVVEDLEAQVLLHCV
jgi:hypothetical protein